MSRERCEILHVRAEDDRFAKCGWFAGILTTGLRDAGQAFTDEYDSRETIPVTKFARGVDDKNIRGFRGLRAARDSKLGEAGRDFIAALYMPGR